MSLRVSPDLSMPLDAVTRTFGIVGQRGTGKSTAAVVLVEELVKSGARAVIADPTGVWHGIRSSADGKSPGINAIVVGGEYGDVPLEEGGGALVAEVVIESSDPVVVLDLKLLRKGAQLHFMADFAEALYHSNRDPLHVVIDEAGRFAPQQPRDRGGYALRLLGAIEDIVKLGRSRGLGCSIIEQRPATINKNVLEQVETLVMFRLMGPNDRKAIHDWVIAQGDLEVEKEVMATVAKLPQGEAWVWSPAFLDFLDRVKFRASRTFDSRATPKVGSKVRSPKRAASPVDVDALRERMKAAVERAEAKDPKKLQQKLAEKDREITKLQRALEERVPDVVKEEVLVEVFPPGAVATLHRIAEDVKGLVGEVGNLPPPSLETARPASKAPTKPQRQLQVPTPAPRRPEAPAPTGDLTLRKGARRMLGVLAAQYPLKLTRVQVGTLSGVKHSGGTFSTYYGELKRNGLIEESGGEVTITQAGLDFLGEAAPAPQTADEILDMYRQRLRAGARNMLDLLVEIHPSTLTKEKLGEAVGITHTGGTYSTYLGDLRRNGLIEVDGQDVRASDTLFIGAA